MQDSSINTQEQPVEHIMSSLRGFFIGGVPCGSRHTPAVHKDFIYKHIVRTQNSSSKRAVNDKNTKKALHNRKLPAVPEIHHGRPGGVNG